MIAEYISVQILVTLRWGTAAMLAALMLGGVLVLLAIMNRFMNLNDYLRRCRAMKREMPKHPPRGGLDCAAVPGGARAGVNTGFANPEALPVDAGRRVFASPFRVPVLERGWLSSFWQSAVIAIASAALPP
jgi:hypothetical protein